MRDERTTFWADELIPKYWDLKVETIDDIVFLGQATIREMIRFWRSHAEQLGKRIKKTDELFKFLQGKKATDIRNFAERYENPKFNSFQIGVRRDSQDPEPLDKASKERKMGSTNFNICGWCEYASGGTSRCDYHITTSCRFESNADGWTARERHFNTPCCLREADDLVFGQLRLRLAKTRFRLIKEKRETDAKIKFLLERERLAERKPVLPLQRPDDWFNVENSVVGYIGDVKQVTIWKIFGEILIDSLDRLDILKRLKIPLYNKLVGQEKDTIRITRKKWATATVIPGFRHQDGYVSVCFAKRVHNGSYLEGHGFGYGAYRPEVMHDWEFEYLLQHPEFAEVWVNSVPNHFGGFDPKQLLMDFAIT